MKDAKDEQNRRRFTRIQFDGETTLVQAQQRWPINLIDISLKGALIANSNIEPIRAEMPLALIITLDSDVVIQMDVELAHRNEDFLGLHCTSIDMESISHLRRLIELNLKDSKASERILEELVAAR